MAKDFLDELSKSYMIPMQIAVGSGDSPTDMRQTCETVEDFVSIAEQGLELRYDGLVTYETKNKRWMGCKKIDGEFKWETLSDFAEKDHVHKEYLPKLSFNQPEITMPEGHVWLEEENK